MRFPHEVGMPLEFMKDASSTHFAFERQRSRNAGTIALPVYGNPPKDNQDWPNGGTSSAPVATVPCRIVRLHAPIESMIIVWTAAKDGAAPVVPNPYLFDPNLIFKLGRCSAACPIDIPGYRGHGWSMTGEYHYHMQNPKDLNSSMSVGITPWEVNIAVTDAIIPNTNFINSLLEKLPSGFSDPVFIPP